MDTNEVNSIFIDKNSDIGILLLHGFTGTPYEVKDLSVYLSSLGFTVYAPLMAGHGTSPEDLSKTTHLDWEASVRKAYIRLRNKTKKVFLIGNSFGSNMAFWLAKEFNNEQLGIVSLSAPIYLKYHNFILLRIYTYGWLRKYYRKPRRLYTNLWAFFKSLWYKKNVEVKNTEFLGKADYNLIPVKSFREFIKFINKETIPNLKNINKPIFIAHAKNDLVVLPKSAEYIYNNIGSKKKDFFWFPHKGHIMTYDPNRQELFERIYKFIKEVV